MGEDQAHWPLSGQVVELLPWSAALVNNQKLAEMHGHLAKVNGSYNPNDKTFFIDTAPPPPAGSGGRQRGCASRQGGRGEHGGGGGPAPPAPSTT